MRNPMSFFASLFGGSRKALDKRVHDRWGTQPWVGVYVSSGGVSRKSAPRAFVRYVKTSCAHLEAPVYITLSESWFRERSVVGVGLCWIKVSWPERSDGHLMAPALSSYLRGLCGLTQLSVAERRMENFDAVMEHHKDLVVWRINFKKH